MSGYIGASPVPQATQHREAFTATASQTSFPTVGYTPQFVDVYLNGVKLAAADYTATNGSDIVLTTGAALNDILEYVAYTPFEVASQTFTGTTTVDVLDVTGAATGTDLTLSGGLYVGGTGAANYLDDYEEGTWTPVLGDGVNADATYTTQKGVYTKVGNLVTVTAQVTISSLGTITGSIRISGLPFTSQSAETAIQPAVNLSYGAGLAVTAGTYISGRIGSNSTFLSLTPWDLTTGVSAMVASEFSADGSIILTATYTTA